MFHLIFFFLLCVIIIIIISGLYPTEPKLPANVINAIEGVPPNHVITTVDPKLEANGLPSYPHLPGHLDSRRIEEIRRTLVVANLDSSVSAEQLLEFFGNNSVEIKYLRLCTRDSDTEHYALVELTEQALVVPALQLNGKLLAEKPIKVGINFIYFIFFLYILTSYCWIFKIFVEYLFI